MRSQYQPPTPEQREALRELRSKQKREGFFRLDARARLKNARE